MSEQTVVGIGGDILGYRIEEVLGRGGMGVVYRAFDVRLKRSVALKLIAPEVALDDAFRERFARESELAMSLEHPNVVPIHDAGEFDGHLYLVMRHVDGTDVRTLLRDEGPLAPERAVAITGQIANALDAAHARGLVHRDVKPSNVLLGEGEHVYLADFGLTRRVSEPGTQLSDARSLGTPAYLAPEQIEGGPVDGRADVYSLGCLLYECLTGEAPFSAVSRLAVAWAHLEEEPPRASERNPRLPEAVDPVIGKAMAKEPDERYATCRAFVTAAEAALGVGRSAGWRRRVLALAAAVVATAALAAALVAGAGGDGPASLAVGPNTLVRVDPQTNKVAAVVDVGSFPSATAVSGDTVWVYNFVDDTVSELDARTNEVRHVTEVPTAPSVAEGSVLAADRGGAWVVGLSRDGHGLLTRVLPGGHGTQEHDLGANVDEVVLGEGVLWVLAHRTQRNVIIRVDPRTGTATRRTWLPADVVQFRMNGLAVGGGFVWASDQDAGTLYRVDPATGTVRARDLGEYILRPVFGFGRVWACVATGRGASMMRVHPGTLRDTLVGKGLPAEEGRYVVAYESVWRHDVPSGTLMRFDPRTGDLMGLVHVKQSDSPAQAGLQVTSMTAGAGSVWLTVV